MSNSHDSIFAKILQKTNLLTDELYTNKNFLFDLCSYFNIAQGFIYTRDFTGNFIKSDFYRASYAKAHPETLDMRNLLGLELLSELSSRKIVLAQGDEKESKLEDLLTEIFHCSTLIFVPILNQHYELSAFIGLSDRRKFAASASNQFDIDASSSLLSLLASRVKLNMFEKNIDNAEKVLNNVLNNLNVDIYVNDYYTHDILYANKSMAAPYGGIENMLGKKCYASIFSGKTEQCEFCPQTKLIDETGKPNKTYSWDYQRALDGSWFRVFSSCIPWTDGRIAHLVESVDITENKENQILIEKLAQFDYLTGLPNRRSLHDQLESFIDDKSLFSDEFYVLFCDLDGFKNINDTLGHHAGDVLLKALSHELKNLPKEDIRAYRHGGDEFVILIRDFKDISKLKKYIDTLFEIFCNTYAFAGREMKCGCSIGACHFPSNATSIKELFHIADVAMYSAKQSGKGTIHFISNDKFLTLDEYFKQLV